MPHKEHLIFSNLDILHLKVAGRGKMALIDKKSFKALAKVSDNGVKKTLYWGVFYYGR